MDSPSPNAKFKECMGAASKLFSTSKVEALEAYKSCVILCPSSESHRLLNNILLCLPNPKERYEAAEWAFKLTCHPLAVDFSLSPPGWAKGLAFKADSGRLQKTLFLLVKSGLEMSPPPADMSTNRAGGLLKVALAMGRNKDIEKLARQIAEGSVGAKPKTTNAERAIRLAVAQGTTEERNVAATKVAEVGSDDPLVLRFMIDRGEFWGNSKLMGGKGAEEAVMKKIGSDYEAGDTSFARKAVSCMPESRSVCMAALQECSLADRLDPSEEKLGVRERGEKVRSWEERSDELRRRNIRSASLFRSYTSVLYVSAADLSVAFSSQIKERTGRKNKVDEEVTGIAKAVAERKGCDEYVWGHVVKALRGKYEIVEAVFGVDGPETEGVEKVPTGR